MDCWVARMSHSSTNISKMHVGKHPGIFVMLKHKHTFPSLSSDAWYQGWGAAGFPGALNYNSHPWPLPWWLEPMGVRFQNHLEGHTFPTLLYMLHVIAIKDRGGVSNFWLKGSMWPKGPPPLTHSHFPGLLPLLHLPLLLGPLFFVVELFPSDQHKWNSREGRCRLSWLVANSICIWQACRACITI